VSEKLLTTNLYRRKLIRNLRKLAKTTRKPIWERVAELLERPRRKRVAVNLGRIGRLASEGETVVVPGRVLGGGTLDKRLTVIAESYTKQALQKILACNGQALTLYEVVKNPSLVEGRRGLKLVV